MNTIKNNKSLTIEKKKFLFFIIILEWNLMLNINQFMEKALKY